MDHVIGGKFKLGRKIGSGSFGELYLGVSQNGFSCFVFFWNFCIFSKRGDDSFVLFIMAAVNVQTGEEVAVKLVCDWVLNGRIFTIFILLSTNRLPSISSSCYINFTIDCFL